MQKIADITEDEVIALFLKTEINSDRFKKYILDILVRDGRNREIMDSPDTSNKEDNKYRAAVLGETRGYGQNKWLFNGFPSDVKWLRAQLTKEELKKAKLIKYDSKSTNSRKPEEVAEKIRQDEEVPGQNRELILKAVQAMNDGVQFPEMILVTKNNTSELVVLEGHLRMIAYQLSKKFPDSIEVILGLSPELDNWAFY